jgi:hypothetical protein
MSARSVRGVSERTSWVPIGAPVQPSSSRHAASRHLGGRPLGGPRQGCSASPRICFADFGLDSARARLVGNYRTTWSFPLLHNGSLRSCRVGRRKVKKTPCNSLFNHDLMRPTLTPCKHVLTCANRTDLVIHDPHRPDAIAHLIKVRSCQNDPTRIGGRSEGRLNPPPLRSGSGFARLRG